MYQYYTCPGNVWSQVPAAALHPPATWRHLVPNAFERSPRGFRRPITGILLLLG